MDQVYDANVRRRHEFLWDWLQARPQAELDGHVPCVIQRDGRLVGYTGLLRRRFKVGSREVDGGFLIDTFTTPESRGAGIILLRHLIERTDLLMGAPRDRAEGLWKKMLDRTNLTAFNVRKAIRMVDPARFLPLPIRGIGAPPARLLASVLEFANRLSAPRLDSGRVETVVRFPAEVGSF